MTSGVKPNLVIAGVYKAGTTSLFMYLLAHPEICGSKIKETNYFMPLRYGSKDLPPIKQYLQNFSHCKETKYVMEATARYYYGGAAVARAIKATLENPKIILVFREPISRLFSFYRFEKSMLKLDRNLTFDNYIRLCESMPRVEREKSENLAYTGIDSGFYSDYLSDWFDVFGKDVRIVFFEKLVANPKSVLSEICEWLGVEAENFTDSVDYSVENKTVNFRNKSLQKFALWLNWKTEAFWRSHRKLKQLIRQLYYALNGASHRDEIPPDTRARLEKVFQPYNRLLAIELSQRGYHDLPSWLEKELSAVYPDH